MATTAANPSSIVLSPAGSGSTLAVKTFVHGSQRQDDGPVADRGTNVDMDGLGRSLVIQFTADGESLVPTKPREILPPMVAENSGWSRPAGLIIDPRESQEEAGLCSSSATPHDAYRLPSANCLNDRQQGEDVARAAAEKLSDAGHPKQKGELQNDGVIRTSECTAPPEAHDRPRAGTDNAALLAAGALLDLSSSLVDEGYNTSSIGSSTGNVIESETLRRKQTEGEIGMEPETSGSNDEDKRGRTIRPEEPLAEQTGKRRRIKTAWADFETDMSVGKKRRKPVESDKGIDMPAQAKTSVLLGPAERRKSGEGKKSIVMDVQKTSVSPGTTDRRKSGEKKSIVMPVQETSVLPRPAHRKRYRPIVQLMQETPVVDAVYSEDED